MHASADPGRPPSGRPGRPESPDALESRLVLGISAIFCLAPFPDLVPPLVLAAAAVPLAATAAGRGCRGATHLALVLAPALVFLALPVLSRTWPVPLLLALGAYGLALRAIPGLGGRPGWLVAGRMRPADLALAAAFAIAAIVALLLWVRLAAPDLADLRARIPAGLSWPALIGLGAAFAVANAFAEEAVFRGVLQSTLAAALRSPLLALALQAVAFGVLHAQGFPRGVVGVVLAAVYGAVMGVLRLRTGGIALPILAHVAADAAIFAILAGQLA